MHKHHEYPKMVYHKDFKSELDADKQLHHTKIVKSEEEEKAAGSDWGHHPAHKKTAKEPEEKKPAASEKQKA